MNEYHLHPACLDASFKKNWLELLVLLEITMPGGSGGTAAINGTPTERTRMIKWQDIQVCSFCLWKGKCENEFFGENYQLKCDYYLLLQSGEAHQVTQFHIVNWEPSGRCSNLRTIIDVIEEVIMVQMRTGNYPIVVHCR